MSNDSFADKLGIGRRTIATWHEKPERVPQSEMQQILDATLERAPDPVKARFASLVAEHIEALPPTPESAQTLRVAVAIVVHEAEVLLVCRRGDDDGGGISWQFPAGMIKPGVSPETVAVRETLAETGVHCSVVSHIGSRLHPITHVMCDYLHCDYLGGDADNVDVAENVSVAWVHRSRLTRFIPADRIFPPILETLEIRA